MTSDVFDDPRITALGLLTEVQAGIAERMAPLLAEHKLAPAEFDVMLRLSRSPQQRLRMSDLAAQTILSTSGVTRVVDRLERDGLACREPCASDRRAMYAVLTAKGEKRLTAMLPAHHELVEHWFTGQLDPDELTSLLTALRKIRDAVRPDATAGVTGEFAERCMKRPTA
jgi:DNA-binding MarR family transcriptional regulator